MNHIERFYATIERRPVDRPAAWLGIPDESALPKMYEYFGVDTLKVIVKQVMESVVKLKVPLIVECGSGNNWLES